MSILTVGSTYKLLGVQKFDVVDVGLLYKGCFIHYIVYKHNVLKQSIFVKVFCKLYI